MRNTPPESPQLEKINLRELKAGDTIKLSGLTTASQKVIITPEHPAIRKSYVFVVKDADESPWARCIEPSTSRIYARYIRLVDDLSVGGRLIIDFPTQMVSYKTLLHQITDLQLNESTIGEKISSTALVSGINRFASRIRKTLSDN